MKKNISKLLFCILLSILFHYTQIHIVAQIKLISPNNYDTLAAGKPYKIEWVGAKNTDNIKIEFSNDNGKIWSILTNNATNNQYLWNVPSVLNSYECKLKITNNNIERIYDKNPELVWQALYGSSADDYLEKMTMIDNHIVLIGFTNVLDEDIIGLEKTNQNYYLKIDSNGTLDKINGNGKSVSLGYTDLFEINDSTYFGLSNFNEFMNKGYNSYGLYDLNAFIMDKNFKINNNFFYGGSSDDFFSQGIMDKDTNFILYGTTYSQSNDLVCNSGAEKSSDAWLIKIDRNGKLLDSKCFGSESFEEGKLIIKTNDNGYLITMHTGSAKFKYAKTYGGFDQTILKLDSNFNIVWGNTFGGEGLDFIYKVIQSKDNNFYLVGRTNSTRNDIIDARGEFDAWVLKVSIDGNLIWSKNFGGFSDDVFYDIIELDNQELLITGQSYSYNGNLLIKNVSPDVITLKLDENGNIIWQNAFGGRLFDNSKSLLVVKNNLYIVGITNSVDGSLLLNNLNRKKHDNWNIWLMKLKFAEYESLIDTSDFTFSILPNKLDVVKLDFGEEFQNKTKDTTVFNFIINNGRVTNSISSINITGDNFDSFKVLDFIPQKLYPDKSLDVKMRFAPQILGLNNAVAEITTNIDTIYTNLTGIGIEDLSSVSNFNKVNKDYEITSNNEFIEIIYSKTLNEEVYYNITNINGQIVLKNNFGNNNKNGNKQIISLESIPIGIYNLCIYSKNKKMNYSFLKTD